MLMLFLRLNEPIRRVSSLSYLMTQFIKIFHLNFLYQYKRKNSPIFKGLADFFCQYLKFDLQASAEIWSMTS